MKQLFLLLLISIGRCAAGQFLAIECLAQQRIPINEKNKPQFTKLVKSCITLADLTQFAATNASDMSPGSLLVPLEQETVSFFLDHADKLEKKESASEVFKNGSLKKILKLLAAADFLDHQIAQNALEKTVAYQVSPEKLPENYEDLAKNISAPLSRELEKKCAARILVHHLPLFASVWNKKKVAIQSLNEKPEWVTQKLEQSKKLRDELIKDRKILQKNEDWYRYDALPGNKALVFGSIYGDAVSFERKENEPEYQVRAKEQRVSLNDICFRDAQTILMALDGKVIEWRPAHTKEKILFQEKNSLVDRLTIDRKKNIAATFHSELCSSGRHLVLWRAKPWRMLAKIEISRFEGHAYELLLSDDLSQLYINVKGSNDYSHLTVDLGPIMAAYSLFKQFLPNATLKDALLMLYGLKSTSAHQLLANNSHLAQDVGQAHQFVKDFYQTNTQRSFFYRAWLGLYETIRYLFS